MFWWYNLSIMCGRFVRNSSIPEIAREFNSDEPPFDMEPSYNVAPSQDIVIIINEGKNRLVRCRWGFIPLWAKDEKTRYTMINARAEGIADKPAFHSAFRDHRCLVVADGFYEWRKEGKVKTPVYIRHRSDKPFGMAGLYTIWSSTQREKTCTSTIITTDSNELLMPVHYRMPVIIPKEWHNLWLDQDEKDKDRLLSLLKPYDPDELVLYEVSPKVNSPAYNVPENIMPRTG